ncbi:nickel-dependent hydrogenase large subunit [Rhodopila sp.]|uniref:hydrogenase large subunit n=1 Tax=Rhodopila sp. TaxID=2480087 RepID=UPI003D0F51C3
MTLDAERNRSSTASDIVRSAHAEACRPWRRSVLSHTGWTALAKASMTESWTLLAHWADTTHVHALFQNPDALTIVPVSTQVEAGCYPALSPVLPGAVPYERMIRDLWGHTAEDGSDARPWLDHGQWPQIRPMAIRPQPRDSAETSLLQAVDRPDAMLLPLGPLWGLVDEASHLRLTLNGATIQHAEAVLGFTHKGVLSLMRGKSPRTAARFAARLSGDATVAHSVAFAQATESAMQVTAPPRAALLRIVLLEMERIAAHLDNLAEVGRLADAQLVWTRCGMLRENLSQTSHAAFGHRLLMDCVVPGGLAVDIAEGGAEAILRVLGAIASELDSIRRMHERPALSAVLSGLGRASGELTATLGVGGTVGRASGRAFDGRMVFSTGYGALSPRLAIRSEGDALARQQLRIFEIGESLRLVAAAFDRLPDGPVGMVLPQVSGEGIACAESSRGDVWHWMQLDHGQIAAAFPRDPGWALWPLAEHVLRDAPAADAALIRASLALPASGMDL